MTPLVLPGKTGHLATLRVGVVWWRPCCSTGSCRWVGAWTDRVSAALTALWGHHVASPCWPTHLESAAYVPARIPMRSHRAVWIASTERRGGGGA